jgi:hypothetical protein
MVVPPIIRRDLFSPQELGRGVEEFRIGAYEGEGGL